MTQQHAVNEGLQVLPIPENIAIVGLNIESLITALILRKAYHRDFVNIRIVNIANPTPHSNISLVDKQLNQLLTHYEVPEAQYLKTLKAVPIIATEFDEWSNTEFIIPKKHEADIFFHPLLQEISSLKRQHFDLRLDTNDFFFSHYLSAKKLQITSESFPFAIENGYQVDSNALHELLVEIAENNHIQIDRKDTFDFRLDTSGNIFSEDFGDGNDNEYIFDCSGFSQILTSKLPGYCQKQLPKIRQNNRCLSATLTSTHQDRKITCVAMKAGFLTICNTEQITEIQYFYSSQYTSDEDAKTELLDYIQNKKHTNVASLNLYSSGQHLVAAPWQGNCVALGLTAGFNQLPVVSSIEHLMLSVTDFVDSIQIDANEDEIKAAFNARVTKRYEYCRAFGDLSLLLQSKLDFPYWLIPQDNTLLSEVSGAMLALWRKGEDLSALSVADIIGEQAWYALFCGLDHFPQSNLQKHVNENAIEKEVYEMKRRFEGYSNNLTPINDSFDKPADQKTIENSAVSEEDNV